MTAPDLMNYWDKVGATAVSACQSTSPVMQSGYASFTLSVPNVRALPDLAAHFATPSRTDAPIRCFQFSDPVLFDRAGVVIGTTWFQKTIEALREAGLTGFLNAELGLMEVFDPARRIAVRLLRHDDCVPPWEASSPLANFVNWFNIDQQAYMLHGATISNGRTGALIVAEGGTGKSLLTLASVETGLVTIGDDYSVVRMTNGIVEAARFSTQAKQSLAGLRMLGKAGKRYMAGERNFKDKYVFGIPTLPAPLEVNALVRLTRSDSAPLIVPEKKRELFAAISETTYHQLPATAFETQRFAGDLVRQLPTFRFALGADLKQNADTLKRFLGALHD